MNYPLISEYIEAIKAAEDNFEELTNLRPVLVDDGQPVMTSGNFAVVFKMKDIETGKFYALKCFTKEQEGRAEAYHQIAEELKDVDSPYFVSLRYLDKELFVDTDQSSETEFPVLLMDWVEGKTLDKYLRENLDDKYALEMLAYRFSQLAQWLIPQPFAHGDLKPDNILVREDGTLVLVDYDGMYVPAMKGQKARELGSPDFRHPQRTEDDFDEHIDDFPLVSILLSLKAISFRPQWLEDYGAIDRLLFSEENYLRINNSKLLEVILKTNDEELRKYYSIFLITYINSYIKKNTIVAYIEGIIPSNSTSHTIDPCFLDNPQSSITPYDLIGAWKDKYGVTYSKDGKKLLKGGAVSTVIVREGTIVICDYAFNERFKTKYKYDRNENSYEYIGERLVAIRIPDSVKTIGKCAFGGCESLEYVTLPDSIEEFGPFAFGGCEKLYESLPVINAKIVKGPIDSYAIYSDSLFYEDGVLYNKGKNTIFSVNTKYERRIIKDEINNYYDLAEKPWWAISYEERELRDTEFMGHPVNIYDYSEVIDLIIPETIYQIGDYAFSNSEGICSIFISNSVFYIGEGAFANSSIETIYILNPSLIIRRNMFGNARPQIAVPYGFIDKYMFMLSEDDEEDNFEIIEWDGKIISDDDSEFEENKIITRSPF